MSRPAHQQWVIDEYRAKPRNLKKWAVSWGINALELSIVAGMAYRLSGAEIPEALNNIIGFAAGAYVWFGFILAWLMTFICWIILSICSDFKKDPSNRAVRHTKYQDLKNLIEAVISSPSWVGRIYSRIFGTGGNVAVAGVLVANGWYVYATMFLLGWGFAAFWRMVTKHTVIEAIETIEYDELLYLEDRPVAWGARNEAEAERIRDERRDAHERERAAFTDQLPGTTPLPESRQERPIPGPPEPDETPQPRARGIRDILFREDQ